MTAAGVPEWITDIAIQRPISDTMSFHSLAVSGVWDADALHEVHAFLLGLVPILLPEGRVAVGGILPAVGFVDGDGEVAPVVVERSEGMVVFHGSR